MFNATAPVTHSHVLAPIGPAQRITPAGAAAVLPAKMHRPPFVKARVRKRESLTHEEILANRVEKLNDHLRRETALRELKLARREQAQVERKLAYQQRESRRLQNKRAELATMNYDCNAFLRKVAEKHQLDFEVIGERNGTKACAATRPILVATTYSAGVRALLEAQPGGFPAVIDPDFDHCRVNFFPGHAPQNCHLRSPIGLITVGDLIGELDPVLQTWGSAYVFMDWAESEAWLAEMRKRSPEDAHLPVIRLSAKGELARVLVSAIGGAAALGGLCMLIVWKIKEGAARGWRCLENSSDQNGPVANEAASPAAQPAQDEACSAEEEGDTQAIAMPQMSSIVESDDEQASPETGHSQEA